MDSNLLIALVGIIVIFIVALLLFVLSWRGKQEKKELIKMSKKEVVKVPRVESKQISPAGRNVIDIEGIGPIYAEKLKTQGIKTTSDLLTAGSTRKGREDLAEKTQISAKLILEWVNLSDLFRVKGIGEEYSDLLEETGVDTVVELSKRNPEKLHARILEVNKEKKLVRRVPRLDDVTDWISQAQTLPRKVEY